jgi:ornithine decarboxylase
VYDFSEKFGASADVTITLLEQIKKAGATPALAFNIGSQVTDPKAYAEALMCCRNVLDATSVTIHALDIGGGYPTHYPRMSIAPLNTYFDIITTTRQHLSLPAHIPLLTEPGRALVAECLSVVTQVLLRKEDQLYLNDGIYGNFLETKISPEISYPTRVFRTGGGLSHSYKTWRLYGPTCDGLDALPTPYLLPDNIEAGDWIEFGMLGAYSLCVRTHFNGFYPNKMVTLAYGHEPPFITQDNCSQIFAI